jgi:protein-tyrosine kinase
VAQPRWPPPRRAGRRAAVCRRRDFTCDHLDLEALSAKGIVTPNAPRSFMADQYRVIKRPLIANALGKGATPRVEHGNLIMVTSALSGEGKSFTSINLAMSIAAELDHTVMLVDADVARPSVLKVLGLPPRRACSRCWKARPTWPARCCAPMSTS